jgi:hypothetical protein
MRIMYRYDGRDEESIRHLRAEIADLKSRLNHFLKLSWTRDEQASVYVVKPVDEARKALTAAGFAVNRSASGLVDHQSGARRGDTGQR